MNITRCFLLFASLLGALASTPAGAQTYPREPIKLIIPFTAGGATDVAARMLAEQLSARLGQPVIADNRPGASSTVGAAAVVHAAPNGYTLLFGSSILTTWSLLPGSNVPFDVLTDLAFIGKVARSDEIVVVPSKMKVDDLNGLVSLMRTQPDKVQFGSSGIGTMGHLGGELMKYLTKADALHVPYKGESAALADLLGGQLTFLLCTPSSCLSHLREGTLKGLALTAKSRSKLVPNIPTVAEAGVPGMEVGPWWYLAAPKGTPSPIIERLSGALNDALADEKFRARLQGLGLETEPGTTPATVRSELQGELDKWRPVVKAARITAQ
jgi:tripartite-type tricarboxylate transporter receptor subunit TctC